jgi:hypothetical protein
MIRTYMISFIIRFHLLYEMVVYIEPVIGHYILSNIHVPVYDFISYMNPLIFLPISFYIYSSSTIMPHSSFEGEHYFCPVCDRLFVHGAVV